MVTPTQNRRRDGYRGGTVTPRAAGQCIGAGGGFALETEKSFTPAAVAAAAAAARLSAAAARASRCAPAAPPLTHYSSPPQ